MKLYPTNRYDLEPKQHTSQGSPHTQSATTSGPSRQTICDTKEQLCRQSVYVSQLNPNKRGP